MEHSLPDHQPDHHEGSSDAFDDLLANNKKFAERFDQHGFDGVAHAGVLMITCMDSRIVPLEMVGLTFGDAKIIRTPGGRVTTSALAGCIAGVHLLQVNRIMVIPHSRCAMAAADDDVIIDPSERQWCRRPGCGSACLGRSAAYAASRRREAPESPTCRRPGSRGRLLLRRGHRPPRTLGLVRALLTSGVDGGSV